MEIGLMPTSFGVSIPRRNDLTVCPGRASLYVRLHSPWEKTAQERHEYSTFQPDRQPSSPE